MEEDASLSALRARLDEEEAAYAEVLSALDRLAELALPAEASAEVAERLARLNTLWEMPKAPSPGGPGGVLSRWAWSAVAPALQQQSEFNAALVQLLNAYVEPVERLHGQLRELAGALVHYAQRVQPLVDAQSRLASALATTHSELVLETFDRRLESLGRRLDRLREAREQAAAPAKRDPMGGEEEPR